MTNSYRIINEATWERAMHCMVFRNSVEPAFCVTFEADVTELKKYVKDNNISFTLAMVYAVCRCANQIEAFRYRFVDGKIVLFDNIDTAFTYLNKKTNLFKVVNVPMMNIVSMLKRLQMSKRNISWDHLAMMFFNVLLCLG